MGWTFSTSWRSKTDLQRHLTETDTGRSETTAWITERWTWVGTNLWTVMRVEQGEACDRFIVLYLTQYGGADHGWGYQDIGESMGPFEVNCPLPYLENLSPPRGEWSGPWREKVRAYHAERARIRAWRKGLKVGDPVRIGRSVYTLTLPVGRTWANGLKLPDSNQIYCARANILRPPEEP